MKQVTVLFCDIVGSTPLTERLGAEAMRDLVSSFLAASLAEVHRYGGTAPQFTGDGFMALFGAPVTQEDHVQRALLAALAIQQALGGTQGTSDADKLTCRCVSASIRAGGARSDHLRVADGSYGDRRHRQSRGSDSAGG
jgi:class 3 adenylate cyclase